ncbi:hypothetical protein GCM10011507_06510 [Edaphobacter acidisoli]|uniref:GGDEF domain-containing protein n=1 Tax=Edaphobacter acidisoli TaxID=2040573 RepID=A0A916RHL6_9BACT|nr:GGDEF domain-containing protein [Edaphobacter acidisoli]GGA57852.1 hypothetical protein GCM10011507_06510 [Edaphobacter acidisoli]
MNYSFLPDLSALTILVVVLFLLHRRHPHKQTDIWLLGLFFTLVEATAHTFYAPHVIPAPLLHVVVLDCYLLAGLIFNWAVDVPGRTRGDRLLFMVMNAVPLLALCTTYGLNIRVAQIYFPTIVLGLVTGVATSIFLRRNVVYAGLFAAGWLFADVLVRDGLYRFVVYWSICVVYLIATVNFYQRLPRNSTGRLAILTGFGTWSICLLIHPWVVMSHGYAELASHLWNLQKSLISIGMILVMLEEQVASNKWLALHDELTGLPNRRLFSDRLPVAIESARQRDSRLALFLLDLNGFKNINDTLGHPAGDQVLREVALHLRESCNLFDSLARLGGDEFVLLASDLTKGHSVAFFEEIIRRAVETAILIDGQPMMVTACLGSAVFPEDAQDASKLLKIADERMYGSKRKVPVGRLQVAAALTPQREA